MQVMHILDADDTKQRTLYIMGMSVMMPMVIVCMIMLMFVLMFVRVVMIMFVVMLQAAI
jgi:hypothetical protein